MKNITKEKLVINCKNAVEHYTGLLTKLHSAYLLTEDEWKGKRYALPGSHSYYSREHKVLVLVEGYENLLLRELVQAVDAKPSPDEDGLAGILTQLVMEEIGKIYGVEVPIDKKNSTACFRESIYPAFGCSHRKIAKAFLSAGGWYVFKRMAALMLQYNYKRFHPSDLDTAMHALRKEMKYVFLYCKGNSAEDKIRMIKRLRELNQGNR